MEDRRTVLTAISLGRLDNPMKLLALVFVLLAGVHSLSAQSKRPALLAGVGQHHHPITTKSLEAQRFFDQGLTLVYAFSHEEATRAGAEEKLGRGMGTKRI